MFDVRKMLDELGDGNEATKKFISDCKFAISMGWKLSEKQVQGLARCYHKEFKKVPPTVGDNPAPTVENACFVTKDGRLIFKRFSEHNSCTIFNAGNNKILVHFASQGIRKILVNDKEKLGLSSLSIKHELIILNKNPIAEVEVPFEVTDIGLIVDITNVPDFNYYEEFTR